MARAFAERSEVVPLLAEVFREHGVEGASLSLISKATGLGKGSLYNFFPGGKEEMLSAVLDDIDRWFETSVFSPLERATPPKDAMQDMLRDVDAYFRSGGRICLVGVIGLGAAREPFAKRIAQYFERWVGALSACLQTAGLSPTVALSRAEEAVAGIQGAIVLSKALGSAEVFRRRLRQIEMHLLETIV
ncbi:transcriptional regulator, TetR family [Fulvimarina manganoxydans]|uniref:Transcriptional regulator, TetR family n=1 Tax=Fulvimarina manganoxydans TaxID=937218 RepID=A0A1W1ZQP0_9HYPH|nr:TetR/AcrR family transcriptional regulator [Fulvimarina manganoxydans]SMC50583.1 transcriptional regulator, TetR family [Fulvimarina manganoxydans]